MRKRTDEVVRSKKVKKVHKEASSVEIPSEECLREKGLIK